MTTVQITLRNVPESVVGQLKKRAQVSGKSFNRVAVEKLSENMVASDGTIGQMFSDWFEDSAVDDATLRAIADHRQEQKTLAEREIKKIEDLGF